MKKKAFAVTVEFVLVVLLCCSVVWICLAKFTDNLGVLFNSDRNYKKIFERRAD